MIFFQCMRCRALLKSLEDDAASVVSCPTCACDNLAPPYSFIYITGLVSRAHDALCAALQLATLATHQPLGKCHPFEAGAFVLARLHEAARACRMDEWLLANLLAMGRYRMTLEPYDFLGNILADRLDRYDRTLRRHDGNGPADAGVQATQRLLEMYLKVCPDDYAKLAPGKPFYVCEGGGLECAPLFAPFEEQYLRPALEVTQALLARRNEIIHLPPLSVQSIAAQTRSRRRVPQEA